MRERDFNIFVPATFFEKAEAPEGRRRRVGGPISSENWDQQEEMVIQRGLDFSHFKYLNDNHAKGMEGIVGVPDRDSIQLYEKGDTMPDGSIAKARCTWAEGWILEGDDRADKIWSKAMALQKAGFDKHLGFSIEGKILQRAGVNGKVIAKAAVTACALTHVPVNTDTYMVTLAKSLVEAQKELEEEEKKKGDKKEDAKDGEKKEAKPPFEREEKSFTMTGGPAGGSGAGERVPLGPVAGMGAGGITTPQSLEHEEKAANPWAVCTSSVGRSDKDKYESCVQSVKHDVKKAWDFLAERGTNMNTVTFDSIVKFISLTRELKRASVI